MVRNASLECSPEKNSIISEFVFFNADVPPGGSTCLGPVVGPELLTPVCPSHESSRTDRCSIPSC